ncbi:MAG: serine hydrolase [Spirochaetes bacterium]|nr:serine hydrolase [Spirochaetota bacterium]
MAGLGPFIDAVEANPALRMRSLLVLRRGVAESECYWEPCRADDRPVMYSVSKAFTAMAAACAVDEGLFSLDDRVVDLLPEDLPPQVDERVTQITVHHLLSMATGHSTAVTAAMFAAPHAQWARTFFSTPPETPAGSRHVYNNGVTWMLGEIIRRKSGQRLLAYLNPRVLTPLGINAAWDTDPLGRELAFSGIHITTRDLARAGELFRLDGMWNGRRLIPEGWVTRMSTRQIVTDPNGPKDWSLGYGYQLWMSQIGYRLDGAYGQFSLVLPQHEAVIAITSAQTKTQTLLDMVWKHLIPALESTSLSGYTANLSLPDARTMRWPDAPQEMFPDLHDVTVSPTADGFTISFTVEGSTVRLNAPAHGWRRTSMALHDGAEVPVAVSAAANDDGTYTALIAFTDSPHILRLDIGNDRSVRMSWNVSPRHYSGMGDLRAH